MDKKTIDFYDHNAEKYSKWRSDQGPDQAQKVFIQNTKPGGYILDLMVRFGGGMILQMEQIQVILRILLMFGHTFVELMMVLL